MVLATDRALLFVHDYRNVIDNKALFFWTESFVQYFSQLPVFNFGTQAQLTFIDICAMSQPEFLHLEGENKFDPRPQNGILAS